ncbi:hypothetical protein GGE45_005880 [Rhizobium aethiopicum]|uniref:hypothetical protein n=1 Tax=Rhizobium aethiopicum TaxID=1138170 RepID=UPI001617AEDB|nr:hypothetical protein [Rhizobium aethiopicum]MBB4583506.1 hypothetical protein [Rhizobium aethiopicum]
MTPLILQIVWHEETSEGIALEDRDDSDVFAQSPWCDRDPDPADEPIEESSND